MSGQHDRDIVPPGSSREWIDHARSDLALAQLGRDAEGVLPAQICFHAQQAVEKALKAVLLHRAVAFPFTHDLEVLMEIATGAGMEMPEWADEVSGLNPFAVETRYPGRSGEVGEGEVDRSLDLARRVLQWAGALVAPPPEEAHGG